MNVLIDTNILVSSLFATDKNHQKAVAALKSLRGKQAVVAAPILVELFYLTVKYASYSEAIEAVRQVRNRFVIEPLIATDMERMEAIMRQYLSAELDYADTAIVAVAERLNITQIYSFDRRDFVIFRPRHCAAFDLMP